MIFVFDDDASKDRLYIRGELYKYLIKVRRHQAGDKIAFRRREEPQILYNYVLEDIGAREALALLESSCVNEVKSPKNLNIGWCVVDANSIEKVLPSLCEIGVAKITFISCERSQKNFKLDFKRFDRIVEAAMQQCGRTSYIEFEEVKNIKEFLEKHPNTKVFDFCKKFFDENVQNIQTVLIGCEGGFSSKERELFKTIDVFRLDTPMVLRSESAVMAIASKILL